ncbi:MAG TPA: hypothetical protein VMW72_04285 [Sedimentisphaerales bacterium]|nr:hypothetical protein [Sedimentisphaerales bacterium]
MKKIALSFLIVCVGLTSSIVPCASAIDSSKGFAFTDKVVLAYYYIWFNENNWIKTAAEGGRKEGLEGLHPLVGAYNSWDPTIIEKHMKQMNRALIDALAVSCENESIAWMLLWVLINQSTPPAAGREHFQQSEVCNVVRKPVDDTDYYRRDYKLSE